MLLNDVLVKHANAKIVLDRRFTNEKQRNEVNRVLEARAGRALNIEHADSQQDACVQLADFVAGASLAKYLRGEDRFLQIVAEKVVAERVVRWGEIVKWQDARAPIYSASDGKVNR